MGMRVKLAQSPAVQPEGSKQERGRQTESFIIIALTLSSVISSYSISPSVPLTCGETNTRL